MSGILQGVVASISESEEYGAVGWASSPYLTFFKKQGNRFIQLTDPTTLPSTPVTVIVWSRFGNYCAALTGQSAFVYLMDGNTPIYKGTASASVLPGVAHISWGRETATATNSGNELYFASTDGGYFYRGFSKEFNGSFNVSGTTESTKTPICTCFLLGYNSSNGAMVVCNSASDANLIDVREMDGLGFSLLPSAIITQPSTAPKYCASRNSGTAFAVVTNAGSNNVIIYTRSAANWDIAHTLSVPGVPMRCAWSADGNLLGVTHDTSPYYSVVDFTGGSPTVVDGTTALAAVGNDITMSRDNFTAITATSVSDFLQMQRRNSDGVWDISSTANFSFSESNALAVSLKNNAYVGN